VVLGVGVKTLSNYTNHIAGTPLDAGFSNAAWRSILSGRLRVRTISPSRDANRPRAVSVGWTCTGHVTESLSLLDNTDEEGVDVFVSWEGRRPVDSTPSTRRI